MQLQSQTPQVPLSFTQNDTVTLNLIALDAAGNPVNLTGASLSTEILGPNPNGPVTFPNSQHTIANQTTNPGCFALTLQPGDTANCGDGANKTIVTEALFSSSQVFFQGFNLLTVYVDIPLQ